MKLALNEWNHLTQGRLDQFLRVRSSDASIATRIDQATARSPTFKRLVATIERTNGIIHVESGVCRGRVASCLPM